MAGEIGLTLTQAVALAGLLQCLVVLGYVAIRTVSLRQAALMLLFFAVLAAGLLGRALAPALPPEPAAGLLLPVLVWTADVLVPPLSVLLIHQVALERRRMGWELALPAVPLLAFLATLGIGASTDICAPQGGMLCGESLALLRLSGVILGAACLLLLWLLRGGLGAMLAQESGRERYALAVALAGVNLVVLSADLAQLMSLLPPRQVELLRAVLPLAFAYLAATLMFRLYPQPVPMKAAPPRPREAAVLRGEDALLAERITRLMEEDKLYQEQSFARADLARELEVSESQVSRAVNAAFGKSFPQLINHYRVREAKSLLESGDLSITDIAFQVGFNSLPSFNRAFRELAGSSPSAWRERQRSHRQAVPAGGPPT